MHTEIFFKFIKDILIKGIIVINFSITKELKPLLFIRRSLCREDWARVIYGI